MAFVITWREYEDGLWELREVLQKAYKWLHEKVE